MRENSMLRADGLAAMTAGIAHDFKNLFAPFHLGLDVVEHQPVDAQSRHMLGLMQNNLKQANHLIEELLAFGSVTSAEVTYRPVALQIIRGHQGDINITSVPGQGTTATLLFPPLADASVSNSFQSHG